MSDFSLNPFFNLIALFTFVVCSQRAYVTLSVLYLGSVNSIKVDFGTSGGPIVPPTPFPPTPPPQKPYRTPAAVWEDQISDIPNPNPYK